MFDVLVVVMIIVFYNDNGWIGVKMGIDWLLMFGLDEMSRLKEIVLGVIFDLKGGGSYWFVDGFLDVYVKDFIEWLNLKCLIKVVVVCGNGMVGVFVLKILEVFGVEVILFDVDFDYMFLCYNFNLEDM